MTQHTLLRFAALIIFTLAFTTLAYGVGPQRTFVSAQTGNDANTVNNCSLLQPCRNFNAAVGVVAAGGEVVALDSGGYGVTTISKAVTLTSPSGVYAAVTALTAGSNAITVSAASTDTVVLRGLTLTGLGGDYGVNVTSIGNLHVEGCVVSGFTANGIYINLTASGSNIFIKDTIMRNNSAGFFITSTGTVRAYIDNCRAERNSTGFLVSNNARVTISRSVASGNVGGSGFYALGISAGTTAELSCEECVASGNVFGFIVDTFSGSGATMRVSHSTSTDNASSGFDQSHTGVFQSLGNNMARGNGTEKTGTITVITPD